MLSQISHLQPTAQTHDETRNRLVMASNRGPVEHSFDDNGRIRRHDAAGGVATALNSVAKQQATRKRERVMITPRERPSLCPAGILDPCGTLILALSGSSEPGIDGRLLAGWRWPQGEERLVHRLRVVRWRSFETVDSPRSRSIYNG